MAAEESERGGGRERALLLWLHLEGPAEPSLAPLSRALWGVVRGSPAADGAFIIHNRTGRGSRCVRPRRRAVWLGEVRGEKVAPGNFSPVPGDPSWPGLLDLINFWNAAPDAHAVELRRGSREHLHNGPPAHLGPVAERAGGPL